MPRAVPLLQSSYILFGVISGGIFFEEFAGLHNGPAGMGGWPLFVLGMLAILSGLALIAPPPSAQERAPSSPRTRSARVSRHEADGEGEGPLEQSAALDDHGFVEDAPMPRPAAGHRRGGSLGKGGIALAALRGKDGPEARSLVANEGADAPPRKAQHTRSPSRDQRNAALAMSEVVLSLDEGDADGIAPVAEDLATGLALASRAAVGSGPASPPHVTCVISPSALSPSESARSPQPNSPRSPATAPPMQSPVVRVSRPETTAADAESGAPAQGVRSPASSAPDVANDLV